VCLQPGNNEHEQRHIENVFVELSVSREISRYQKPQQKHQPGPAEAVGKQVRAPLPDQEEQAGKRDEYIEDVIRPF